MLSLIPSFIVLLLKGCLGLLQYLLHCLCGRFIDFQPFGFYGSLGHASGFLRLFFSLLPTSLIISRAIHAHFSENAQFCFLSTSLTSFPCAWILFHDGCHLYAIGICCSCRTSTVSFVFFCFITSELYFIFKCYTLQ